MSLATNRPPTWVFMQDVQIWLSHHKDAINFVLGAVIRLKRVIKNLIIKINEFFFCSVEHNAGGIAE